LTCAGISSSEPVFATVPPRTAKVDSGPPSVTYAPATAVVCTGTYGGEKLVAYGERKAIHSSPSRTSKKWQRYSMMVISAPAVPLTTSAGRSAIVRTGVPAMSIEPRRTTVPLAMRAALSTIGGRLCHDMPGSERHASSEAVRLVKVGPVHATIAQNPKARLARRPIEGLTKGAS